MIEIDAMSPAGRTLNEGAVVDVYEAVRRSLFDSRGSTVQFKDVRVRREHRILRSCHYKGSAAH